MAWQNRAMARRCYVEHGNGRAQYSSEGMQMAEQVSLFDASAMAGRRGRPDAGPGVDELAEELAGYYERYERNVRYGCDDPSWADGVNVNLDIDHILYARRRIEERALEMRVRLPEIMARPVPERVPDGYMARADEIRGRARAVLASYRDDVNRKWIEEHRREFAEDELKLHCVDAVLGYAEALEEAIGEDARGTGRETGSRPPLVVMRCHGNAPALDATRNCREKLEALLQDSGRTRTGGHGADITKESGR